MTFASAVRGSVICLALVLIGLLTTRLTLGAEPPKPATAAPKKPINNIDDELLRDLDNELLKDAGGLKPGPRQMETRPGEESEKSIPSEDKPSEEPLDGGDPLTRISQQMRAAESLIPQCAERTRTEQTHERIIEELARLIDEVEQQKSQSKSSSKSSQQQQQQTAQRQTVQQPNSKSGGQPGQNANQPASDSTSRLGQADAARPTAESMQGLMKDSWGHLPQHTREQMLQNSPERFLPQYELLIERFYKRLAEEQRGR